MGKRNPKGFIFINLTSYLKRLRALERSKPEEIRRDVPSLNELGRRIEYSSSTMSRVAGGNFSNFNIKLGAAIIEEMRKMGFDMEITDLIDYVGPPARRPVLTEQISEAENECRIPTTQ